MQTEKLVSNLNTKNRIYRGRMLKKLRKEIGEVDVSSDKTSLCLRSTYSFSSYSPSMLAYLAYKSGTCLAGILDVATLEGAKEFTKGCKLFGVHTCVGVDLKTKPHIADNDYSVCGVVGVAQRNLKTASRFLKPYRDAFREQVTDTVAELNKKIAGLKIKISVSKDVLPLTKVYSGGTVTNRHVWLACSKKFVSAFGKTEMLAKLQEFGLEFSEDEIALLSDYDSNFYEYDLARIIKEKFKTSSKVKFYYKDVVNFAKEINALSFYELRGSAQGKEEEVVKRVKDFGYDAIAFNPRKISLEECERLVSLCEENSIVALSLEIIDFPRKKFDTVLSGELSEKLNKNAWAVAGHQSSVEQGGRGFYEFNDVEFDKKIEILSGVVHPKYYESKSKGE